jgi:hypothetical protein
VLFAVNVGAVATPDASVWTAAGPAKLPLAPEPGPANVTVTPGTGFPPASRTVACNAVEKGVLIAVLCPDPSVAATAAGEPTRFVRLKAATVPTPDALAVTV